MTPEEALALKPEDRVMCHSRYYNAPREFVVIDVEKWRRSHVRVIIALRFDSPPNSWQYVGPETVEMK